MVNKIDRGIDSVTLSHHQDAAKLNKPTVQRKSSVEGNEGDSVSLSISEEARQLSIGTEGADEARAARIAELKAAIGNGTYSVPSSEVASKVVSGLTDFIDDFKPKI